MFSESVPFTQHDVTMFQQKGKARGRRLLIMQVAIILGSWPAATEPLAHLAPSMEVQRDWAKGLKAYSIDGKTWFNQDGIVRLEAPDAARRY